MKIGVDLSVLPKSASHLTGVSNYAYLLSRYLLELRTDHEFVFFAKHQSALTKELEKLGGNIVELPREKYGLSMPHLKRSHVMQKQNLDLLHGTAYTTPIFYQGKTVVSVHDLAIYKHPEWFPAGQGFSKRFLVPRSIKKAGQIIVPSESTKNDLMEIFEVGEGRITVVPLGVESCFFKAENSKYEERNSKQISRTNKQISKLTEFSDFDLNIVSDFGFRISDLSNDYILCVSTIEPRKNLARLIDAYSELPQEILDKYDLVIAGGKGWKYQEALDRFAQLKQAVRGNVKFVGSVSKSELIKLYHEASLFVFVPLYEGFGLPVLEAMAAGLPIVTSNNSSIPEFAKGSSVLVEPTDACEISKEISRLLSDETEVKKLSVAARQKALQYNWSETAINTLKIYESQNT